MMNLLEKLFDYIMLRGWYVQVIEGKASVKELMGEDADLQGTLDLWREDLCRMQSEIQKLDPNGEYVVFTENGAPRIIHRK